MVFRCFSPVLHLLLLVFSGKFPAAVYELLCLLWFLQFDLRKELRQTWRSHGCIGEPVFVPRGGYKSSSSGKEDDGYVLVQLYAPLKHRTEFIVLDAQHIDLGPLARIKLLHHIPYGFHGTFAPHVFLPQPKSSL